MAKNQPLLKNPRMPPKPPRMPKSPVGFNYRQKPQTERPYGCFCRGGPMDGQRILMYRSRPTTMVFTLRGMTGCYDFEKLFEGDNSYADWRPA